LEDPRALANYNARTESITVIHDINPSLKHSDKFAYYICEIAKKKSETQTSMVIVHCFLFFDRTHCPLIQGDITTTFVVHA
jgi:hypothetical protein